MTLLNHLEQIFEILGQPARGKARDAMLGIIEEGRQTMDEYKGSSALDAGLIAAGHAVEHCGIARVWHCEALGRVLANADAAELLNATLAEEIATDNNLSRLADGDNAKAAKKRA